MLTEGTVIGNTHIRTRIYWVLITLLCVLFTSEQWLFYFSQVQETGSVPSLRIIIISILLSIFQTEIVSLRLGIQELFPIRDVMDSIKVLALKYTIFFQHDMPTHA